MRIAFIQDMDPLVEGGGAQWTDRAHILEGFKRGHEIQIIVPQTNLGDLDEKFDLAIISNSMTLRTEQYDSLQRRGIPYVIFAHDFGVWLCKWRLLFPMEERCRDQCYLRDRWRPYLQASRLIVWLSPLHRRSWLFAYPDLRTHPYHLSPSPVSPQEFYPMGLPRRGALAVNADQEYKGADNLALWAQAHPDVDITLIGSNPEYQFPSNVKRIGAVRYQKMNEMYNQHEYFVHLPGNIGPFDRVAAEAYLAGCHIVGNRLVGALSWPFFKQGKEAVKAALTASPTKFWEAVERAAR